MGMNSNLDAYIDVREAFNYALAHNGGEYVLPNKNVATRWRHRAYYFRKLIREHNWTGLSEYDEIVISVVQTPVGAWAARIEIMPWNIGVFVPADGRPLEAIAPEPANSKEMLLAKMQDILPKPEHHASINKSLGILATVPAVNTDTVTEDDADAWARGEE